MQKTNFRFEILLGEDESTDGTREICLRYGKRYPDKIRLFLHSRKNNIKINGQPTGRFNFLYNIYKARGKYLAICEGDDYWTDPYKLQKQVDFLENNPDYGMVHTDCDYLYDSTGRVIQNYHKSRKVRIPVGNVFEDLLIENFIKTATVFTKRDLLYSYQLKYAEDDKKFLMGDYPRWLEIAKHHKVGYISDSTAVRRVNSNSVSSHKTKIELYKFIKAGYDVFNFFVQKYGASWDTQKKAMTYYSSIFLTGAIILNDLDLYFKSYDFLKNYVPDKLTLHHKFINLLIKSFFLRKIIIFIYKYKINAT